MCADTRPVLTGLQVSTVRATEIVDLTDRLAQLIADAGVRDGLAIVQTRHTTTGLMVNEAEPLLWEDLDARFAGWAPDQDGYAHDDLQRRVVNVGPHERRNGFAHCRAALLRTSETLLVTGGRLWLGRWQRLLFVDFDGPQRREIAVALVPLAAVDAGDVVHAGVTNGVTSVLARGRGVG